MIPTIVVEKREREEMTVKRKREDIVIHHRLLKKTADIDDTNAGIPHLSQLRGEGDADIHHHHQETEKLRSITIDTVDLILAIKDILRVKEREVIHVRADPDTRRVMTAVLTVTRDLTDTIGMTHLISHHQAAPPLSRGKVKLLHRRATGKLYPGHVAPQIMIRVIKSSDDTIFLIL
jgi:hypothetical protein